MGVAQLMSRGGGGGGGTNCVGAGGAGLPVAPPISAMSAAYCNQGVD